MTSNNLFTADASASPLSPGTHDARIDGLTQRYHVAGRGPVCLVIPGGPGLSWEYMRMTALEEHLTLVYMEPLGTGGSSRLPSHPDGYTLDRYVAALDELVQHLGRPRVYLIGHSHGGFVAQRYAIAHAERLAGIILYASSAYTGPEWGAAAGRSMEEFAARHAEDPELKTVLEVWQSLPSIADDEGLTRAARGIIPFYSVAYWREEGGKEAWKALQGSVRGFYVRENNPDGAPGADPYLDDREALRQVETPALVVVGHGDPILGPRWGREINSLIDGSELLELADSGHFGHLEQPEDFTAAVAGFVARTA